MGILLVSLLLVVTIYLLVTEKIPLDLTAMGIIVVLMVTGILTPQEALAGFSNSAVIVIASLFILSRGLIQTGALMFVSDKLIEHTQGNSRRILLISMLGVAIPSAFINNTPVVVLFISIIMGVCCEYGLSPSKFLIPISYSSIVGGMCTLLGTSTNLVVSDLSSLYGYGAIRMFELSPVGVPVAITTIVFLYFAAPRFMPEHKAPICELREKDAPRYLAELIVSADSRLIGQEPLAFFSRKHPGIDIFEVVRGQLIYFPERTDITIIENDILLVRGSASDLINLLSTKIVELPYKADEADFKAQYDTSIIVELIVTPQSRLRGENPIRSNVQKELGIQIIAVRRGVLHYSRQKLADLVLLTGDTLLIQCTRDKLDELRANTDIIVLDDVHHKIIIKRKAPLALAIFLGMVATAASGLADITISAVTAVFLMLVSRCVHLRDAYRAVNAHVLLVIVGALALGAAMEKTGTARFYVESLLVPFQVKNPAVILGALILFACIITELMSNTAAAVLLLPIAVSTASFLGVNAKPFIIGVCFGASCGFAMPIGYQTHLLVYGPGGYRLSDFLKLGIPLDLMVSAICTVMIPFFWPF
jgi:di/tricarboxylate transporter